MHSVAARARRVGVGALVFWAMVLCTRPVWADALDEARRLFHEGAFAAASEAAQPAGTVEAYRIAILGLITHGRYHAAEAERPGFYERALVLAEEARAAFPQEPYILVLSAHVLGRYGKAIGARKALGEGLFRQGREFLEEALRIAPEFGPALGGLGSWHGRLIGEGGFLALLLTEADPDTGRELLERAEPLAGNDVALLFSMARGWDGLGDTARARSLLARALAVPAEGAYAQLIQERVRRMDARLARQVQPQGTTGSGQVSDR